MGWEACLNGDAPWSMGQGHQFRFGFLEYELLLSAISCLILLLLGCKLVTCQPWRTLFLVFARRAVRLSDWRTSTWKSKLLRIVVTFCNINGGFTQFLLIWLCLVGFAGLRIDLPRLRLPLACIVRSLLLLLWFHKLQRMSGAFGCMGDHDYWPLTVGFSLGRE